MQGTGNAAVDPVLVRRDRLGRAAKVGLKLGYGALLIAIVAFVVGALNDLPTWSVVIVTIGLAVATGLLVPAIILGYGVKAAARQDRERRAARMAAETDPPSGGPAPAEDS